MIKQGSYVMLSESAPMEIANKIGREAAMRVEFQLGGVFDEGAFYPAFLCRHLHKGRLTFDHVQGGAIDIRHLVEITKEEALGQSVIHRAMTEDFVNQIFSGGNS